MLKLCLMNGNKIERIIVFPSHDTQADIFTTDELANIKENSIEVIHVPTGIYDDDSIEEVKRKIIMVFERFLSIRISFEEIYLFGVKKASFNPITIYESLTQNNKLDLTRARFIEFLLNFVSINIEEIEMKELYDYSDVISLNLEKDHLIKVPIGQKLVANSNHISYTVNPFDVVVYDNYLKAHVNEILSTTNGSLMLNTGDLFNNTMYICLAVDVFRFNEATQAE